MADANSRPVTRAYAKSLGLMVADLWGVRDMEAEKPTISYSKIGRDLGVDYTINEDLGEQALFPHLFLRNTSFEVNLAKVIIMMVGLPAAGKTTWTEKYSKENPDKKYYTLGRNLITDRQTVI